MRKNQTSPSKEEKVTNEKPVSLSPLGFKEALAALLKIKPKPKPKEEIIEEKAKNQT